MLTKEQGLVPVEGLSVFDAAVLIQIISKSLEAGAITGSELSCVAVTRSRLVAAIHAAVGVNVDNPTAVEAPTEEPQVVSPLNIVLPESGKRSKS